MRQKHVTLHNVQISQLYDLIKEYLKRLKLDIIHDAAAATAGIAAAPVAAIETYRAHSFEKLRTTISDIGKGEAIMSSPVTLTS